jgi:DNA-binding transcriptional LysR family regulator
MELNSIEAIKNAVQSGLGAAFVSTSAIAKELQMGVLHCTPIEGVVVKRTLWLIVNPNRYRSKAAEAFSQEILPQFATPGWDGDALKLSQKNLMLSTLEIDTSTSISSDPE